MNIHRLLNHARSTVALCTLCFIGNAAAETTASVSGKYVGNGKNVALKYVSAKEDEPFNDKPAIRIVFYEKDPAGSDDPEKDAMFGKLGSTLSLRVFRDGEIFSCQVSHTALKKPSFSSSGEFTMTEFKLADGKVTGRVSTGKECEFFGDRYDADLTFTATMATSSHAAAASAPKAPSAALTAPQKAFVDSYKKALIADDTKALAAFLYTEGASADTVEFFTMMQSTGPGMQLESIDLVKPTEDEIKKYNKPTEMPDGQLCKMPFPPTHQMIIVTKDGAGGTSTSRLPVGEHKGKLLIPLPVPVKASAKKSTQAPSSVPTAKDIEAMANKAIQDALKNLPKGLR